MRYMIGLMAALAALPAMAAPWKIDAARSALSFSGKQGDQPFSGQFTRFTPLVEFDPAQPEHGNITVRVDVASVKVDDKNQQDALPTEDWFFTRQYPTAIFTSQQITRQGDGYDVAGSLSLRGVSKPVTLHFTLEQGAVAHAHGTAQLNRADFGIGQGQWKDDKWIAYPVTVSFDIYATKG